MNIMLTIFGCYAVFSAICIAGPQLCRDLAKIKVNWSRFGELTLKTIGWLLGAVLYLVLLAVIGFFSLHVAAGIFLCTVVLWGLDQNEKEKQREYRKMIREELERERQYLKDADDFNLIP